jgi:hypothetical protein
MVVGLAHGDMIGDSFGIGISKVCITIDFVGIPDIGCYPDVFTRLFVLMVRQLLLSAPRHFYASYLCGILFRDAWAAILVPVRADGRHDDCVSESLEA